MRNDWLNLTLYAKTEYGTSTYRAECAFASGIVHVYKDEERLGMGRLDPEALAKDQFIIRGVEFEDSGAVLAELSIWLKEDEILHWEDSAGHIMMADDAVRQLARRYVETTAMLPPEMAHLFAIFSRGDAQNVPFPGDRRARWDKFEAERQELHDRHAEDLRELRKAEAEDRGFGTDEAADF